MTSSQKSSSDSPLTSGHVLYVYQMEITDYREAWDLQRALVERRKAGVIPDTLLLLQHPPIITLGRNVGAQSLLFSKEYLNDMGVDLVESDRGGDATYHGPGQLVAYPIIDLRPNMRDIPRFVRKLEQVMLNVMSDYGLTGGRVQGAPGAWLFNPDRKLGAVGARISRWITHHGLALNVNTHLPHFQLIIPCGLSDKGVSSLAHELGASLDLQEVSARLIKHFGDLFNREVYLFQGPPDLPSLL